MNSEHNKNFVNDLLEEEHKNKQINGVKREFSYSMFRNPP